MARIHPHSARPGRAFAPLLCALSVLTALAASAAPGPAQGAQATRPADEVHLYSNEFLLPGLEARSAARTVEAVRAAVAPKKLVVHAVTLEALEAAVEAQKADLAIVGSAIYWRHKHNGLRDVATLTTPLQPDPDHAVGALVLTRADRTDIQTLKDLKGKVLGINLANGFQCYLTLLKDLADMGYDPETFFRAARPYGLDPEPRLAALRRGEVDAVTVNACWTERMREAGRDPLAGLKTVGVRAQSQAKCMTSTSLYPNWSFLISPNLSSETIVKIATALYRMPTSPDGERWTIASDYSSADALYRTLRAGPYAYLNSWTLERLWNEHHDLIVLVLLLLAFGVWHSLRTQHLVDVRTRQLHESFEKQKRLARAAQEAEEKLANLRSAFTVSQLSSMVAHELSQPLSAILMYARGLKIMMGAEARKSPDPAVLADALGKIEERTARAQEIVRAVRSCAKADEVTFSALDLREVLRSAVRNALDNGVLKPQSLELELPARPLLVMGSTLELELALTNLVKNAAEAAASASSPKVHVSASAGEERIIVRIWDNGPEVTDALLARLREPVRSLKPDGLGLGLSIVRAVVEKHMGRIIFERGPLGGLAASVILPPAP